MQHTCDRRKCNGQHTGNGNTIISPVYGRGRKKLIRDRSASTTPTPGLEINARSTTEDNPNVITVVDQNGNTDLLKTENIEQTDNQNEQNIRKYIRTIRCYYYHSKLEFITVIHICYVCTCNYFLKKGEFGMTSLHAILYIQTKNSSSGNLVPVSNATTQHCADLFINL